MTNRATTTSRPTATTTGESYGMDCYDEDDYVECTGGTEALVTFPMQAVREY